MIVKNVDEAYLHLCQELLKAPAYGNTHELTNVKIEIEDITNNVVSVRGLSTSYLFGELLWYFNADDSVDYISKFSSFWEHISDDGTTSNSAYGYRLMKKHGFNQIDKIVELLQKDPLSRRAVLNINIPNEHVIETKDEPCTIAIQFLVRDEKLNCTVMMRSNDIWFGTPYDWAFFMELQKVVADRLGLAYGTYVHFATSLHLYDRDFDKIQAVVDHPTSKLVIYDRKQFHTHSKLLFNVTKACDKDSAKSTLMYMLNIFDIYRGDKK